MIDRAFIEIISVCILYKAIKTFFTKMRII